jgi:hypothetical protein
MVRFVDKYIYHFKMEKDVRQLRGLSNQSRCSHRTDRTTQTVSREEI